MEGKTLEMLQPYCENDMKRLKKMSQLIFLKFSEPLAKSDYDDFYSIANQTLWQAYNAYDSDAGVSFEGFLYSCLQKKFKTELTHRHRQKRILNQFAVSLDAVNENTEDSSLMDFITSDSDTYEEAVRGRFSDRVEQYLSGLSNRQVNILNLLMDGYRPDEIRRILDISAKEYTDNLQIMRSYENVKILF